MRRLILIIQVILITVFLSSCTADKNIDDLIETKTNLTSIEIINYLPNNSISISSGYTRQSLNKMDFETYSKFNDEFKNANINDKHLYFDSLSYKTLMKIGDFDIYSQKHLASIIRNDFEESDTTITYPTEENTYLSSIISYEEKNLLATIELPKDNSSNWSIVKIWSFDPIKKRPQIHSTLIAKANCFEYINIINQNLYLGDCDFIYRVVLEDDYRLGKDMDVFVSMDTHKLID